MQFDTVIQTPIANTTASSPEPAPESSVQDDLEKYPLLAVRSDFSGGYGGEWVCAVGRFL